MEINSNKIDNTLLGVSYLFSIFGFNFLFALICSWIFRKKYSLCLGLLQSALIQFPFFILSSVIFLFYAWDLFLYGNPLTSEIIKTKWLPVSITLSVFIFIILSCLSFYAFNGKEIKIPIIYNLSKKIIRFLTVKKISRALCLNLILPGFGFLYLGKVVLGISLIFTFLFSLFILGFLVLGFFYFPLAKDLLSLFGFYLRIKDSEIFNGQTELLYIAIMLIILVLIYYITIKFTLQKQGFKQRLVVSSFSFAYVIQLFCLISIFLIPFIFSTGEVKEAIDKRAKEIYERLKKEKEKNKDKKQIKKAEKEINISFDLIIPEKIDGLNDFSTKPFSNKSDKEIKKTEIGFNDKGNFSERELMKKASRYSKSYSEYISSKVRENNRDQIIWEKSNNKPYAMIIEYFVEPNGSISQINVVESSNDLETDAVVISVIESMNPMMPTSAGEKLRITELFWNSSDPSNLNTKFKRFLANYPDGRIIEKI